MTLDHSRIFNVAKIEKILNINMKIDSFVKTVSFMEFRVSQRTVRVSFLSYCQ